MVVVVIITMGMVEIMMGMIVAVTLLRPTSSHLRARAAPGGEAAAQGPPLWRRRLRGKQARAN